MSRNDSSENEPNAGLPGPRRHARVGGAGARARLLGLLVGSLSLGATPALAGHESPGEAESTRLEDLGPEKFNALGEHMTGGGGTRCHGWCVVVDGARQTLERWGFVVSIMIGRGSDGSAGQVDLARRYLKWVWGVVSVSRASPEDIAAVTGLPAKQAEAIVAY